MALPIKALWPYIMRLSLAHGDRYDRARLTFVAAL
jgi:hypothetical protein